MPAVLDRAHEDLRRNQMWLARRRLEGYIGASGYHPEVLELLGDVCWQMGDVPAAGRYWFFTPVDNDAKRTAVEVFVRQNNGRGAQILSQLPRKLVRSRLARYPADVQRRLQILAQSPAPPEKRARALARRAHPRSRFADSFAVALLSVIAIFFLYCFSLGVAELFKSL
jgi:hypothetical protein